MSLRASMMVLICVVMLATLALGSVATYLHALSKVETEMAAAIAVGGRIAINAVDDVEEAHNPRRRLELLVADFDGDRHLKAEVRDEGGRVILSSKTAAPVEPVPGWFYRLIAREPLEVTVDLPLAFRSLGRFVLRTDSHNEISEVWDEMLKSLGVLFAFCVMTLGLVNFMIGHALRPLEKLSVALGELGGKRQVQHIPEEGPFELSRVYHGFNEMVERLSHAEAENRALQEQLTTLQEEERAEIARDLHDEIGPLLFSADVDAARVSGLIENDGRGELKDRVQGIRDSVQRMNRHVREMLSRLRAGRTSELGLAVAIDNLVAFWSERRPEIDFDVAVPAESLGSRLDGTVFRIVQEAVSNAVKHGGPGMIGIEVADDGATVTVVIRDDGAGLRTGHDGAGYGIKGMRERVERLGGSLEVGSRRNGSGVEVRATLPSAVTAAEPQSNTAEQASTT